MATGKGAVIATLALLFISGCASFTARYDVQGTTAEHAARLKADTDECRGHAKSFAQRPLFRSLPSEPATQDSSWWRVLESVIVLPGNATSRGQPGAVYVGSQPTWEWKPTATDAETAARIYADCLRDRGYDVTVRP